MKHYFILALALLCLQIAFADDTATKNVDSKIEKVTVYLDGAQVTRTAHTTAPTGKTEITFSGLSPYLDKSSLLVQATGNISVISVVQQMNKLKEQQKKKDEDELQKRKNEFNRQLEDETSLKDVYAENETMLIKNQLVNSDHTDLKVIDLKAAIEYHELKLREIKTAILAQQRKITALTDTIYKIEAQLKSTNANQDPSTSDVVVTIDSKLGGEVSFNISYFVNYAGWFPNYDIRVDDISKPMKMAYRANVHQNTGEDWKNVKLTLSNAEPKISGVLPTLNTWYLSNGSVSNPAALYNYNNAYAGRTPNASVTEVQGMVYDDTNEPLIGATIVVKGTTIGTSTDYDGHYSLKLPNGLNYLTVNYVGYKTQDIPVFANEINIRMTQSNMTLDEVTISSSKYKMKREELTSYDKMGYMNSVPGVSLRSDGRPAQTVALETNINTTETFSPTTYSFDIETPYTIPNNGKTYAVDIKTQTIPVDYIYVTVPKLDNDAFLTARLTNWDEYNLLDGEANLYFEGTYLGKTLLNTSAEDDTIEISLGRDKNVSVTRTKLKEFSKRTFFGDKKIASRAFDITVRNNKKQPISIVVLDQFPVSTQKEIEVDKQEYNEATLDEATGQLMWTLQIPSSSDKKVGLKYAVKYPKNYIVQLEQ